MSNNKWIDYKAYSLEKRFKEFLETQIELDPEFLETQIELDPEFQEALNEFSSILGNQKPTKKRF